MKEAIRAFLDERANEGTNPVAELLTVIFVTCQIAREADLDLDIDERKWFADIFGIAAEGLEEESGKEALGYR